MAPPALVYAARPSGINALRTCTIVLATLLLLPGCGKPERQLDPIRVQIVDEKGEPATWARLLLRVAGKEVVSKWDAERALLILPRESAPHGVMVSAEGHRRLVVDGIEDDRTITLPKGLIVKIQVRGERAGPGTPRHPATHTPLGGQGPRRGCRCQSPDHRDLRPDVSRPGPGRGSLPVLPTAHWGYGVSPTDAGNGIYMPEPGSYVVHWGLLDLGRRDLGTRWKKARACASR